MASRLCDAIESVAGTIPQLAMVAGTLRKQMSRNPVPDEDILAQLNWLSNMVQAVIDGPDEKPETDNTPIEYDLTDADIRILEILGNGEDLLPPMEMDNG